MFEIKKTTLSPVYRFDRSFTEKWYKKIGWLMFAVSAIFILFLLVSLYLFPNQEDFEISDANGPQGRLILLFRLLHDPSAVDKLAVGARVFGLIVVIAGMIIFMGMFISVASNILNTHVERYENGKFSYTFDYHYIILGFNHSTPALIRKIRENKERLKNSIVILSDMPSNEIRTILNNELSKDILQNVVIKNGQRTSKDVLRSLKIDKALEVWIVGEVNEFGHDPLNIKCFNTIIEICKESETYIKDRTVESDKQICKESETYIKSKTEEYDKLLSVFIQFEEQSTLSAFQSIDISKNWKIKINADGSTTKDKSLIRFKASNYHDDWARKLIVTRKYNGAKGMYPALDAPNGKPTGYDSDKHVHLVIFGMTQMGLAVAKRAAHNLHLPNFERDSKLKTTITFIDKNAKQGMDMFRNRYAQIFEIQSSEYKDFTNDEIIEKHYTPTKYSGNHADFLDINYQFIQAEPESERVHEYLTQLAKEENTLLSIAVCHDDPNTNLNIGLDLPYHIYYPKQEDKVIPVFIRQFTCGSLVDIFNEGKYKNVYPFGMWDECDFNGENEYRMAKKVNRTYCDANDTTFRESDINNDWKNSGVTDQWSSMFSADSVEIKLRCVNGNINDNIDILSRVEHNRWNMAQLLMGFYFDDTIKEKDKIKLVHPDIKPFDELLENTQKKDKYIVGKIPAMIKNLGPTK